VEKVMKKIVAWVSKDGEEINWKKYYYFECLLNDLTGFDLKEDLCAETIKYMAKRLKDTPFSKFFIHKYTIFDDDYKRLVLDFNKHANLEYKIGVRYEEEEVYRMPELSIRY
jgi:hypothetical protein